MTKSTNQSWGGRFSEPTDAFVERFTASVDFDQRLAHHDIQGSIAHATMLARVGVLTDEERDAVVEGLGEIRGEIESGTFEWSVALEDVARAGTGRLEIEHDPDYRPPDSEVIARG